MPQVSIRKSNHGSKENKGDTDDSKNENENNVLVIVITPRSRE